MVFLYMCNENTSSDEEWEHIGYTAQKDTKPSMTDTKSEWLTTDMELKHIGQQK